MPYIIADLHLDHASIIDYCNRPYDTVDEMNQALITNWNTTINPDDDIIFLGDLTVKSGVTPIYNSVDQLHGNWTFIIGNHDTVAPTIAANTTAATINTASNRRDQNQSKN